MELDGEIFKPEEKVWEEIKVKPYHTRKV